MDNQSNENKDNLPVITLFNEREQKLLEEVEREGVRPISPTLASQMFQLFLEGYSCTEIAKQNKPFREGDILFVRKKQNWDEQKDSYAKELNSQIRDKLIKQKLESLEFLTNMLSVTHKAQKDKMLKYLQTGDEKDRPETWISGTKSYKDILEAIRTVTGEDRVTKQEVKSESKVTIDSNQPLNLITPELQTKLLKQLADKGNKSE